jgi:hypothetical protein
MLGMNVGAPAIRRMNGAMWLDTAVGSSLFRDRNKRIFPQESSHQFNLKVSSGWHTERPDGTPLQFSDPLTLLRKPTNKI